MKRSDPANPATTGGNEYWPTYSLVFRIIRNVLWPIILLIVGGVVLTKPDQAQELIYALTLDGLKLDSWHYWFVLLAVAIWSLTLLTSSRLLLQVAPLEVPNTAVVRWLGVWLPLFLAMGPYVITGTALYLHQFHPAHTNLGNFWLYWIVLIVAFAIQLFLSIRYVETNRHKSLLVAQSSLSMDWQLQFQTAMRGNLLVNTALVVASVALFFTNLSYTVSPTVGTAAVFLFGLAFFTLAGSAVVYFNNNRYRPVTAVLIVLILLFSRWNDNSRIQTVPDNLTTRPELVDHFKDWITARKPQPNQKIPLILVAAEGGGIRAMNWTADMLLYMNQRIPDFDHYLYAISGVSGGGVGGTFYTAYRYDQLLNSSRTTKVNDANFHQTLHEDYLAPVVAALLFLTSTQSVLPAGINYFDRTKWLENSWGRGYHQNLGTPALENNFLHLWQKGPGRYNPSLYNYNLPALFLNGTLAESGQKVITTNINIAPLTRSPSYFTDVLDVLDTIHASVPAKTAALLCARFPVVTGGGWLTRENPRADIGHVTDGGYFDNTGIETTLQILNTLQPQIDTLRKQKIEVIPYILFIQNSSELDEMGPDKTIHFLRGIREPIASLYNPWGRSSITRDKLYKTLASRLRQSTVYVNLKLNRKGKAFPLGWYLCSATADSLNMQTVGAYAKANQANSPYASQAFALDSLKKMIP